MIKFAYTILYVADVNKSIAFYETAFGFARKFISPDGDYGELQVGETMLSFASVSLAQTNLKVVSGKAAYQSSLLALRSVLQHWM